MKKQKIKHEEPITSCSKEDEMAITFTVFAFIVFIIVIIVENLL